MGDGAEERQNPAFSGSQLGELSPLGPQSSAPLPGTLPVGGEARSGGGLVAFIPPGLPLSQLSTAAPWELWDAGALAGGAHPH